MAPDEADDRDDASPDESKKERVDRELIELLNEVRVALPGVQVLFAFLLVVPFNQRFLELTTAERWAYYAALLSTALAAALLIAPSSYHRLRFRHGDKEQMLLTSNRLLVSGLALAALSIALAVGLISEFVFGPPRSGCRTRDRSVAGVVLVRPSLVPPDAGMTKPLGSARPEAGNEGLYPPIRDLATIGDGRTVAVVSLDGTVVWLPVPYVDSPTIFASLLDARRGGRCTLAPLEPFEVRRRYVPETNVLETTFVTDGGVARVTDALTLPIGDGLEPFRELARRIEGISGVVRLRWSVEPRFGYGGDVATIDQRSGIPVATGGGQAVAVCSWDAGSPQLSDGSMRHRSKRPKAPPRSSHCRWPTRNRWSSRPGLTWSGGWVGRSPGGAGGPTPARRAARGASRS